MRILVRRLECCLQKVPKKCVVHVATSCWFEFRLEQEIRFNRNILACLYKCVPCLCLVCSLAPNATTTTTVACLANNKNCAAKEDLIRKKKTKEKYERNEIKSNENEHEIMIEHDTDVFIVASFLWQQFYLHVMEVQKSCIQCSMFDVLYLRRL